MKIAKLKSLLFGILYIALLGALSTTLLMIYLDQRADHISDAQRAYKEAIAETKSTLMSLVEDIAKDPLIQQNVDWGLNNSVSKRLEAQLVTGKLDALYLAKGDCSTLAFASIGKGDLQDCETLGSTGGFQWYVSNNVPVLAFSKPLKHGEHGVMLIQGHVRLGDNWQHRLTFLATPWNSEHLSFATWNKGTEILPLVVEGPSKSGQMVASMGYLGNDLDAYLGQASESPKVSYQWPLGLMIIALVVLILLHFTVIQQSGSRNTELHRIHSLLREASEDRAISTTTDQNLTDHSTPAEIIKTIYQIRKYHEHEIDMLLQKIRIFTEGQSRNDHDVEALAGKFSELAKMESLSQQLSRSSNFILENVAAIQETAMDLKSILSAGLEENGKFICNLLALWKDKINARGSRKFLRSLSETESDIPGTSALDDQLNTIFIASQGLADQAIGARLHSAKVIDMTQTLSEHAARWKELIDSNIEPGTNSLSLKKLAHGINTLLQSDSQLHAWTITAPRDHIFSEVLEVPFTILSSALYHATLATYFAANSDQKVELSLRYRKKDDTNVIILSPPANLSELIAFCSPAGQEQLGLIKRLLAPYQIQCENLRLGPGFYPITFRWTDKRTHLSQQLPEKTVGIQDYI